MSSDLETFSTIHIQDSMSSETSICTKHLSFLLQETKLFRTDCFCAVNGIYCNASSSVSTQKKRPIFGIYRLAELLSFIYGFMLK